MADVVTDVSKLNGWFKTKHGQFQDNIPEVAKFSGMLGSIVKAEKIGRDFRFPVELSLPQGVTYAASGAGAFDFEETVAGEMKEATIDGSQIVVSDIIDYEAAAKAVAEGPEAYGDAGQRLVKRIRKAGQKRIELAMWYGQHNLGVVSAASTSGSTRVLTLTDASWAAGVWTGMKNMRLSVYTDTTYGTLRNAANTPFVITAVDVKNKKITVSGTNFANIVANDVIIPYHSRAESGGPPHTAKDMVGIHGIVTNTGSLFGIDAASYELWSGNTFDCGSVAFSLKKLQDAICDSVSKGLDEKATVFVSPRTWANLCADQAALRRYGAELTLTNGARKLTMYSMNGELEIVPHTVIKEGEAWILPVERWMKIGAQDLGFNVPGRGEEYFENVPGKAGYRLMAYAHLAIICGAPGMCTMVQNIVNA